MLSKSALERAAATTVELYGSDARLKAASLARERRSAGDEQGWAFWTEIEGIIASRAGDKIMLH